MMFGGETDEATAQRIIDKAGAAGINFIDTADAYHAGRSEQVVGRAIAAQREDWVVATKFGYPSSATAGPNQQGQSRKWIMQNVEASLKRLGSDYIDILYFHRILTDAPMEEGLRAVDDLIRQGKVRYYGVSNFHGWRIAEMVRIADSSASSARRSASRCTTSSTAVPKSSSYRSRATMALAWCPTARWRAAY